MGTYYTTENKQNVTYATLRGSAVRDIIDADTAEEDSFFESESIGGSSSADGISVDTTNFDSNLSSLDDDLQKVVETLDDLTAAAGAVTASNVAAGTFPLGNFVFQENVTVGGNAVVSTDLSVSGNTSVTGNLDTSGTLDITGDATFASNISIGGDISVTGTLSGVNASEITVIASAFSGNLSSTDDTVQKVADKVDALILSTSTVAWGSLTGNIADQADLGDLAGLNTVTSSLIQSLVSTKVTVDDTSFSGNLVSGDNTIQKVADKLDALQLGTEFITTTEYEYTGTYVYFGGTINSEWMINRFDESGIKTTADIENNSGTADLATAWTNRASLTYS